LRGKVIPDAHATAFIRRGEPKVLPFIE